MDLDALKSLSTPQPPAGWSPGVTWDGESGYVTTHPTSDTDKPGEDQWDHVLEHFGLDPAVYMIDGPVRHSVWDVPNHGTQRSYRARVVMRPERTFNVEDLIETMCDYVPGPSEGEEGSRVVVIADAHIGKSREDGAGSDMLVKRWMDSAQAAITDNAPHEEINLVLAGDLCEGIVSNGGAGIASMDLTMTEQIRVASWLVRDTVELALNHARKVVVSVTCGNHGEVTRQQHRPAEENYDILIAANVEMAMSGQYEDRLSFYYPESNRTSLTYQFGSTAICLVHGHRFKGKMNGAERWWSGNIQNDRPAKDANILVAGHFHGAEVKNWTKNRWIMFAPALEDESNWLAEIDGSTSRPGFMYFDVKDGEPCRISIA